MQMIYKPFGKTGIQMSALGFGAMRLPMAETNGVKHVDYDKAVPMMQRAFELGVNYVDTAPYYCEKDSEVAVGKALKGWRDKVYLSTKNPIEDASGDHWRERLESSLKKLDTDYIDFYHMWGITLETFRTMIDVKGGPIEAARKALDEGLIKHLSFSFHDDPKNMMPIIDSGYFSSVLCQYNLLDRSNEEGIAYAREKGLGVVIMGPVGGGRLGSPSEAIKGLVDKGVQSTAEMALRFVLANPNATVALSGMSEMSMVEENAKVASIEGPLTGEELAHVEKMLEENKRLAELYCTGCKYCMPCPQGINIPHVFNLMNYHKVYGLTDYARGEYAKLLTPLAERGGNGAERGLDASVCVECGQCESKCPQHLKIIEQLKETDGVLR
jgi:predicted aldo/keto reductase-like oxidoreductase